MTPTTPLLRLWFVKLTRMCVVGQCTATHADMLYDHLSGYTCYKLISITKQSKWKNGCDTFFHRVVC